MWSLRRTKDDDRRFQLFCHVMQPVGSRSGADRTELHVGCGFDTASLAQQAFRLRPSISHPLGVYATRADRSRSRVDRNDNGTRT
jgi:hypothetical protein